VEFAEAKHSEPRARLPVFYRHKLREGISRWPESSRIKEESAEVPPSLAPIGTEPCCVYVQLDCLLEAVSLHGRLCALRQLLE
jgi:hypothetical protein